ncbi:unnamed protein product, partial [Prorocentrum cordatum]
LGGGGTLECSSIWPAEGLAFLQDALLSQVRPYLRGRWPGHSRSRAGAEAQALPPLPSPVWALPRATASMSAAPARGGKGVGPVPPPPPRGGKGAKGGPPPPPSQPRGKGPAACGKGGAGRSCRAPPPDLTAPENAAVP